MSMSFVSEALPWIAPPLVGAAIGSVLSDAAQRVILRPLLLRYLSSLVTTQTVRDLVHSEKTKAPFASGISAATDELLNQPLSHVVAEGTAALGKPLQTLLSDAVQKLLSSRAFIYTTREVIGLLVESLSTKRLREVLGGPGPKAFVTGKILPLLADEKRRSSIARSVMSLFAGNAGTILDDRLLDELATALEPYAPQVADRIVSWLKSSETRSYLSDKGRELLPRILEKLNVMQRFLLSAGQFDKRLTEKMPEIVDETIATLESIARDPAQQRRVLRLLVDISRDARDGLSKEQPGEGLAGTLEHVIGRFLQGLGNPDSGEALFVRLRETFLAEDTTIGAFVRKSFGVQSGDIAESASQKVLELATNEESARGIARHVLAWVERSVQTNGSVKVKDVLHIDPARKEKLDTFLLEKLLQRIDKSAPEIQKAIDLEGRIRPVIAAPLRWIDLFGAALGLTIGLFQLLLRLIGLS